ncbi:hypothetical protein ACVXZZ_13150 [Staphylococcus aureus]
MRQQGNTGALMSAGLFIVGRIKGVARPALVVTLPTIDGKGFVFLDVGANADAKPEHSSQYAQLGEYHAQKLEVLIIQNLIIKYRNELAKGNSLTKKSYELLNHDHSLNFVGNIEAKTLVDGDTDVGSYRWLYWEHGP